MSTVRSEDSTTSSAWMLRFCATLHISCWSTLLSSKAGAIDVHTTALSCKDDDEALVGSGSCSLPPELRGSCGAAGAIVARAGAVVGTPVSTANINDAGGTVTIWEAEGTYVADLEQDQWPWPGRKAQGSKTATGQGAATDPATVSVGDGILVCGTSNSCSSWSSRTLLLTPRILYKTTREERSPSVLESGVWG